MKKLLYIARYKALAVLLLLLLALAPAMAQNVAYTGDVTTFAVEQQDGDTYEWALYDNGTGNFATKTDYCPATSAIFVGGVNIGASVDVKWLKAGIYFFKVTAHNITGCTSNLKVGIIEVKVKVTAVITPPDTAGVCIGLPVSLEVTFTGTAPWSFTYLSIDIDGVSTTNTVTNVTDNPYMLMIDPLPGKTTDYWISKVSDLYGTNLEPSIKVTQRINPLPDPSKIIHR